MPKKPSNVRQAGSLVEGFFRAVGEMGGEVFGDYVRRGQLQEMVRTALLKVDKLLRLERGFEGAVERLTATLAPHISPDSFDVTRNRGMENRSKAASVAVAEKLRQGNIRREMEEILAPLQKAG